MNFVKKTAILAISLLMVGPMVYASSGAAKSVGAAAAAAAAGAADVLHAGGGSGSGGGDAEFGNPHDGDPKKGILSSLFGTVSDYAKYSLDLGKNHWVMSGSLSALGAFGLLYKFNDAVKKRVNEGYAAAKAKVSSGYSAVRSKVQPALDHAITGGDVIKTAVIAGTLGVIYKFMPDDILEKSKTKLTEAKDWFMKSHWNQGITVGGIAAVATAGYIGTKVYKARKAKTPTDATAAAAAGVDVDEEDDE